MKGAGDRTFIGSQSGSWHGLQVIALKLVVALIGSFSKIAPAHAMALSGWFCPGFLPPKD